MICLVLGMHRSGTSVVAGLLHESGIAMGTERTFLPRPSDENLLGFYEDARFRVVNDALLARSRYRVKSWRLPVPDVGETRVLAPAMRALVRRRQAQGEPWGWKDPRQLLTLRAWRPVLAEVTSDVRVAWVHRQPEAVARSMVARGNVGGRSRALALYDAYTERALDVLEAWRPRLALVRYEQLVRDPMTGRRPLAELVERDIPVSVVDRLVEPTLDRSGGGDGGQPSLLLDRLRALER